MSNGRRHTKSPNLRIVDGDEREPRWDQEALESLLGTLAAKQERTYQFLDAHVDKMDQFVDAQTMHNMMVMGCLKKVMVALNIDLEEPLDIDPVISPTKTGAQRKRA